MQRILLIVMLIALGALTAIALAEHGLIGLFQVALSTTAGMQVFLDLAIALALFLAWMWGDAKATGRNPWPWLVITLSIGSFGPLLYLLTRKAGAQPAA